jgi:hypothetical protein
VELRFFRHSTLRDSCSVPCGLIFSEPEVHCTTGEMSFQLAGDARPALAAGGLQPCSLDK